jgi:hypothetical protein
VFALREQPTLGNTSVLRALRGSGPKGIQANRDSLSHPRTAISRLETIRYLDWVDMRNESGRAFDRTCRATALPFRDYAPAVMA